MKKVNAIILLTVSLVLVASCNNDERAKLVNSKIQQHYSKLDNQAVNLSKINALILLPREGCEGCISDASRMAIDLLAERNDIAIIFTVVNDMKLLKRQFDNSLLKSELVSIDTQNLFSDDRVTSIYPQIAYLKHGKCYKVEDFGNESEEFMKLFTPQK